ncbi:MAG: hypothetical protein J6C39_00840 [Clostridia bacterium]|nr:hypothetical protein [Clostridia bacterium]MBO5207207.1 hypothetical protein [Clostridia bacterium]MBP3583045.1 hypothetical protein [Clostridia bacterium]MBQ8584357.1 hypothetical protein [Clostridia bacterium]
MDFSKYGYKAKASCESCEFYEYDEYTDTYGCNLSLDEDEAAGLFSGTRRECPYYRYYDEYKSVHKQI